MDSDLIKTLITHGRENPLLEWKEKLNVHDKGEQAEFVLDMLSLVNAHGTGSRYLLIGVRNDGTVVGVEEKVDDATLQQIVNYRVEPPIEFSTSYVPYCDLTVGIIEIACSSKRFHVVSRDLTENGQQHLREGDSRIKKGSSKAPPDAWDYERLREAVAEQSEPQPIIRLSFQDSSDEIAVCPLWRSPKPAGALRPNVVVALFRVEGPPPSAAELPFIISNDGEQGAEDVRVFMDMPEGCKVWEPGPGHSAVLSKPGAVGIWVDKGDNHIGMRADQLTHGLHTRPMFAKVLFPWADATYEFTWTGHASNMKKQTEGVLRVSVSR